MSMPEKIKRTIKKYGDYVDLFKNGTKEEIELVNSYMGNIIHEMQERRKCDQEWKCQKKLQKSLISMATI